MKKNDFENLPREATQKDAAAIVQFQILMAKETEDIQLDEGVVSKGVDAVFRDSSKGKYYVYEIDGRIVACLLTTFEWSDWRNGKVLWIQSLYVDKEFRGKGIFRILYDYLINLVKTDAALRGIRLYVDRTNTPAINIYTKLGMTNQHYELFEWMNGTF